MCKEYFSIEEIKKLNQDLENLKNIDKPKIIEEIKNSKMLGDLSENSEYHYAKKKKYLIDQKIKNIENTISNCLIKNNIEIKKIILEDIKNKKIIVYNITKENKKNKWNISIDSPIINLIKGKNVGDIIKLKKCGKEINMKISSIE
ncbi:Transcription elongation factor GreA [Candidatus Nasuia deltocephalinicola]|uniref:Transcription elongation factor GreA n=1 Tax=Candidatus Nasuia deltocephalincola TaxID=1160784 RepID=A0A0S2UP98_9PROT|nr:Transcription elongation factor GreA [Candidatus Nasuia deltocephalinicola]